MGLVGFKAGSPIVAEARDNDKQSQLILNLSPSSSLLSFTKVTLRLRRQKLTGSANLSATFWNGCMYGGRHAGRWGLGEGRLIMGRQCPTSPYGPAPTYRVIDIS